MVVYKTLILFIFLSECRSEKPLSASHMEGFIIGGGDVKKIKEQPHSMFIVFACPDKSSTEEYWLCGASILTQNIFLTAAHCFGLCQMTMRAYTGTEEMDKPKTIIRVVNTYKKHLYFGERENTNDIALLATKRPLPFGTNVRRVLISHRLSNKITMATVAGWGNAQDTSHSGISKHLRVVTQIIKPSRFCTKKLGEMLPVGQLCAQNSVKNHPDIHDSGSALISRNGQQIGIVSYRIPAKQELVVYTNVSHYYRWIKKQSSILFCKVSKMRQENNEDYYYGEDPDDPSL